MLRLGTGPDRWRWLLLVSVAVHVGSLGVLRLFPAPEGEDRAATWTLEVRRPTQALQIEVPRTPATATIEPEQRVLDGAWVKATVESERPDRATTQQAARDQRARHGGADDMRPRPGTSSTPVARPQPPGGRPALASQAGTPLSQRGGLHEGPHAMARGHRGGGGSAGARGGGSQAAQAFSVPWRPLAVRRHTHQEGVRHQPAAAVSPAPRPAPRQRSATGNARRAAPEPRPVPAAPAVTDGAVPSRRHEPLGDPVAELREALGWGPLDRDALAPRPEDPGAARHSGGEDGGGPPFPDASDWRRASDARGTPLGVWAEQVDGAVNRRWAELELPLDQRALGLQGDVTVRYHVAGSGRVRRVHVVRSSGHASLDALAVSAVPARLPRPPKASRAVGIIYEHTLGYRNPLVLVSPPMRPAPQTSPCGSANPPLRFLGEAG